MKTPLLGLLLVLLSNFAFGQTTLYTFSGGGTEGNWNDALSWTTDPTGSTSVGPRVPQANDNLVVTNSFVLNLTDHVATTGLRLTIQRGGVLDLKTFGFQTPTATAVTLIQLAGQGTLRIARPYFPVVTTNDFDDVNTGTVEFYDWTGTQTIPTAAAAFNNLRFLNTTGTSYTAQLSANLRLRGNLTLVDATFSTPPPPPAQVPAPKLVLNLGQTANAPVALTVDGSVSVGGGTKLGVTAVTGAHRLEVSGNFINRGRVRLHNGVSTADNPVAAPTGNNDAQAALLSFRGNTEANFACEGPTDLSRLEVNKGFDSQVLLNITSTTNRTNATGNLHLNSFNEGDILILINGVAKLGNNISLPKIHNFNPNDLTNDRGWFQLGTPSTSPTLWIDGATVQNNNADAGLFVVYGTYRISGGRFESLCDGGMVVREDGQVQVEEGTTVVNKFRPSSTSVNHRGSFIISGGTFRSQGTVPTTFNDNFPRFAVPYITQSFRMTGGTIIVETPELNGNDGLLHIGVNPNNAIVTGGTVEIIVPNSNTNAKLLTTSPLWNLTISKPVFTTGTSKAVLDNVNLPFPAGQVTTAQPLTVLNDFLINGAASTTFDAFGQNVNIQGTLTIGPNGIYLPGTNTTTFSGGQNQVLLNNGSIGTPAATPAANTNTFNNLVVDKSAGTLTLGGTATTYTTAGTLSLLNGVLNDGGKIVNVLGNMVNSASHTSGGGTGRITLAGTGAQTISGNGEGVFGNLRVLSRGSGTVAITASMSVANVLSLGYVLDIGVNRLWLTNVSTNAITNLGGEFSAQRMVRTAGNQSDLGLQKTFGGNGNFTFPVGTGTGTGVKYTPATITLQVATPLARYGQVSVSPTNMRNPFVTTGASALAYYWKVRSMGFSPLPAGPSIDMAFRSPDIAAAVTPAIATYIPGRYLPVAWTKYEDVNFVDEDAGTVNFNGLNQFEGEFTAGVPAAFGPVTAYYSRLVNNGSGNWEDPNTWSTVSHTGAAATAPPGPGNPVFIGSASTGTTRIYHTVNVTANAAKAGSLVIDRGSVLDVRTFTGHNFGALPDAKIGGSGRLRVGTGTATVFPGGDFGSFLQPGGGTVEYYTANNQTITVPAASETNLALTSYRNLWLNAAPGGLVNLPNLNLRVHSQLRAGVPTTFPGEVRLSALGAGNLRVDSLLAVQAGTFRFANGTARIITADTDVRVDAGATFDANGAGAAVANALNVGGSVTNNGTLNFNVNGKTASLSFSGAQDANLTGTTGTLTNLRSLAVNKGLGRAARLNVDVAGTLTTPTSDWLTLTNGTLRYAKPSSTLTIHDANSFYLITDNAGLTVDAPDALVTIATNTTVGANLSAVADLRLAGELQILRGRLNVGSTTADAGNDLEYASAGAPTIRVTAGGTLFVNGQLRRTTANTNGSLRYDQTGGEVEVAGFRASVSASRERGLFEVQGPRSIFRMSGGNLTLRRSNTNLAVATPLPRIIGDLYLRPDSTVVTAGTVVLGNTAAGAGNVTVSVESFVPLFDLRVEGGANSTNTNTGLLTGLNPLNLKGSLTIASSANDHAFFNANGLGLNIDQNLINNNPSTGTSAVAADGSITTAGTGGFRPGTRAQTTTFTGKGPAAQLLSGAAGNLTEFGSLTVSNAQTNGTLRLERNVRVIGNLTLSKGTLADNGQTITVLGNVNNSAVHTSTGSGSLVLAGPANQEVDGSNAGKFGNLTLNNAAGANTLANQEVTGQLTLTNGVFNIGSNLLWLSNPTISAVAGTFSATRHIRTNGIVADLGVRKSFPAAAHDFTFPLGAPNRYTPVRMNVTSNSAAGTITVQPVDRAHPSTTATATTELTYYWKLSSTGFNAPTVTQVFTYATEDVNGIEANYRLGRFVNGAWTPLGGIPLAVDAANNTLTNTGVGYFEGDYTGGETGEFGPVPTFYSRLPNAAQPGGANWDDPASWTLVDDPNGPSALMVPTLANPVVIRSGHLIRTNGNSRGAANLRLLGTLDVSADRANNFNTVTGNGTLRIGSTLFPAGNYEAFVTPVTGGTVDYTGSAQLPPRDTYNNLMFSGSGTTKRLSNLDLTIHGSLTTEAGTTVNNPTSQSLILTSATLGATLGGTFNLNDGPLTTAAFLSNTGQLTLGAGVINIGTSLSNSGTVVTGRGNVTVGTGFSNSGTYDASVGSGSLTTATFTNSGSFLAGTGSLTTSGNFNNEAGGDFAGASGAVTVGGSLRNAGRYTSSNNTLRIIGDFTNTGTGAFQAEQSTMVLEGNFTNAGGENFDGGTGLVQFRADANRTITGNTSFSRLQKLRPNTLQFGPNTNVTVRDLLTLQSGLIATGTVNKLILVNTTTQPIVGTGISAYVAGRLQMSLPDATASSREFPVGLGGRFRPVTITQGASTSPVVLVEIFNGAPAGRPDNSLANLSANRYYRIQLQSGTLNSPTVQLSFNTDVEDEEVNVPGNVRVARSTGNAGPWSSAGGAGVFSPEDPRGYTISAPMSAPNSIDGNSFFALGSTNVENNPLTGVAPLPVELVQFTATKQGAVARLDWATASEKNSAYFSVQRSADGRSFTDIGRVAAQGNSRRRHDYTLLDSAPLAGLNYYRLRQVDQDGKFAYSPVLSLRFEAAGGKPALLAYPNPAAPQGFRLQAINPGAGAATVQLFDNVGRLVLSQTTAAGVAETAIVPAQPLASGMYFATWQTAGGVKLTTKVVVE